MVVKMTKEASSVIITFRSTKKIALCFFIILFASRNLYQAQKTTSSLGTSTILYEEIIPLTSVSTLSADVVKVSHFPDLAKIIIYLKTPASERHCEFPTFRARLSGHAIAIVEWDVPTIVDMDDAGHSDQSNEIVGHYRVPSKGKYYIEIISLFCERISYNTNFKAMCFEDPNRHRITADTASIQVSKDVPIAGMHIGFWKWKDPTKEIVPLFTRFQGQGCLGQVNNQTCNDAANLTRFDDYTFTWSGPKSDEELNNKYTGLQPLKLCLIGFSHTRAMLAQMNSLRIPRNKIIYHWAKSRYPNNIDADFVQELINLNCSKALVGVGQWPASYSERRPYLFAEWELRMREAIGRLKNASIDTLLRSIHYNPINERTGSCPPGDWRSLPVIGGYNAILEKLSKELDVPYIETTKYFTGPV
jgi:hypothetical protein